ncbi:formate--tetrahydrofolate ligase [Desulforamulus hydrothermalis]|uniref:Formate--tetrahydrofolate ligase n=1 Tax=Desulforamulus hydrothermalis Lam5 = DSM 18033 TaxID=1121428 RepID=K8EJ64_9FIRM|nr:formate--tetrahydrofolate ligase [Desulforamulus hydrothermalis]CCO08641.1 Formate--tetrahydrofolate ligase [Desulforamulus hydrothermalis Lam5 = DSM 18033]SHH00489.1 Formate-tetrahydrofolate ligase [Desulforamulus hydrothermalis Lam5 = DSM 18033]
MKHVPSDLEIAQAHQMLPISEVAAGIGLGEDDIDLYGKYKAKIKLDVLHKFQDRPQGKLIDVTAITPTPLGEGKTVTTIGLTQGLGKIGKRVITTLRQPSMGPVFGIKGGAAGGGYAQVVPMEDINIHFTGDIHAVQAANNLLAAMIDTSILLGNPLNIDPMTVMWNRVLDTNDRALRDIVIGLGGKENGYPRQTGFDMAVASEVMAILALAENLHDLRRRLGRIVVAYTYEGKPVTAEDLKAAGAMTVIMKEALKPNLVQTLEGQACIMHAGPFANIAHGNNSVLADKIALRLADYVVTESGFGSDLGMEKFMNIKCRQSGLRPSCVVITCTIRALKMHGGLGHVVAGKPLPAELTRENLPALAQGCANLAHHIKVAGYFGVPVVVSINRFSTDTDAEVALVRQKALEAGALGAYPITVWADGGEGAVELAEAVVAACEKPADFQLLYPDHLSIKEKIEILATKVYNADGVIYEPLAERKIKQFEELGLGRLPICMAKTHLSVSHDPARKGLPHNYLFPIRDIRASVGAGFLYPLAGAMRTMPGLGSKPAAHQVDIDEQGRTVGLF